MRLLIDVVNGRDNNFHLLRMAAACMVLASHSVALVTGRPELEPWRASFGVTPGSVAVDLFFVISGLLVTQSLDRRQDAVSFLRARFLRIWPGLMVALLLTVLLLGPSVTRLPLTEYFNRWETWRYLVKNATLLPWGLEWTLPGVFSGNPIPAVNGSLWTLPLEVRCYFWLLISWWLVRRFGAGRLFPWVVTVAAIVMMGLHLAEVAVKPVEKSGWRLPAMFVAGSVAYYWRAAVPVGGVLLIGCLAALVSGIAWAPAFPWAYSLSLPLFVLAVAYLPSGPLLRYNRLGDYSYGMYIYAFPVQQLIIFLWPGLEVWELNLGSGGLTLLFAVSSWHFVENPALRLASSGPRVSKGG